MPEWYLAEPPIEPVDEFYFQAFWDLSSTRSIGMGVGPIPWHMIIQYGDREKLDDDNMEVFKTVILAMDTVYLKWQSAEMDRQSKQSAK